jgi:hypothetical protein
MLVVGWWGGNLAALPLTTNLASWGALSALACVALLAWLVGRDNPPYGDQAA